MARIVAWANAGVDPALMGLVPIPAVRLALQRAGLGVDDMNLIESNEVFAAQACAVSRDLGFDPDKVNPNASGISIGHPVGATGAINTVKAVHELARTSGRLALVTNASATARASPPSWSAARPSQTATMCVSSTRAMPAGSPI